MTDVKVENTGTTAGAPKGARRFLNMNVLGAVILAGAVAASLIQVFTAQRAMATEEKTVIRLCHWQLEAGYRDAMEKIIEEYEALHPDVKVVQIPITEKLYGQWLNTQLMSGEGPDLTEMGQSKMTWQASTLVHYYQSLGELVNEPNPYNKGTVLENKAWRETLVDGMHGGFNESLQDYYQVPTAFALMRLYYNKDLLKQATGSDEAPKTFEELLKISAQVKKLKGNDKRPVTAIVGSYGTGPFTGPLSVAFTADMEGDLDTNLDGNVTPNEAYKAYREGKVDFDSPRIKAMYACYQKLLQQFPGDFSSMDRQTAMFKFVQGRAAMLSTGSWDATSLTTQVDFRLGVCEVPIPAKDDPNFGQYISGRSNEASYGGAVPYGINKGSHHLKQAVDFLQFLTSQKYNQKFNAMADWPPVVLGAEPSELMKPFMPDPVGFTSHVGFDYGGNVQQIYNGALVQYLQDDISYDAFKKIVEDVLKNPNLGGDHAWAREYADKRDEVRSDERTLAMHATRMMMDPTAKGVDEKYRRLMVQQVQKNDGEEFRYQYEKTRGEAIPQE